MSAENQRLPKDLLHEHLEWLLKIGYTVDDIKEWTQTKQQPSTCRHEGFHDSGTISGSDSNLGELEQPSVSVSSSPDLSPVNPSTLAKKGETQFQKTYLIIYSSSEMQGVKRRHLFVGLLPENVKMPAEGRDPQLSDGSL